MAEKEAKNTELMDKIVSLAKRRGFIYQGSDIYGGLAGTWDYGPLGVALKNNIKASWWKKFVDSRMDMFGIDAAILMSSKVWEASGHVAGFSDPMVECENCKKRYRTDHFIDKNSAEYNSIKKELVVKFHDLMAEFEKNYIKDNSLEDKLNVVDSLIEKSQKDFQENSEIGEKLRVAAQAIIDDVKINFKERTESRDLDSKEIENLLKQIKDSSNYLGEVPQIYLNRFVSCPNCSKRSWSSSKTFNMMFKTQAGAMEDSSSTVYLRPETAQGMFVNFKNVVDSFHPKLPFGLAQIGKAFRNEITPRDFIFRVREFEQMEIEYFFRPPATEDEWQQQFAYWKDEMIEWMQSVGIDMAHVHELEVAAEDLAHYSKRTVDFEFDFPFGKKELFGLAYRTDFDLNNHELTYVDEETKTKLVPHVMEPTFGVDRAVLAILTSAYAEEPAKDGEDNEPRVYLKLNPSIAPVIAAVSPLLKNKPELVDKARVIYGAMKAQFGRVMWDDNGNIGKRYRRQDEIGTPYCITVDFDTLTDGTVTVRDRDSGTQERVHEDNLIEYLSKHL